MRLIAYIPGAGIPKELGDLFRLAHIEATEDEIPIGHYPTLTVFDHKFIDVDVIEHDGRKFITVPNFSSAVCVFDSAKCQTEEYQQAFGENAAAPNANVVIDAHILKGKMPTLATDYAAFIQWFRDQVEALDELKDGRLVFKRGELHDIVSKLHYDMWAVYRHYLMLNGDMTVTLQDNGEISINDPYVSGHTVHDWLIEANKRLHPLTVESDLLSVFVNFSYDVRNEQDFAYYFVGKDGSYSKRPVDPSEFIYLANHYLFPKVTVTGDIGNQLVTFDYREFFPERFHEFNDTAWRYSVYARKLLPFI